MPAKRNPKKSRKPSPSRPDAQPTDVDALGRTPSTPMALLPGGASPNPVGSGAVVPDRVLPGGALPGSLRSGPVVPDGASPGAPLPGATSLPGVALPVEGLPGAMPIDPVSPRPTPPKAAPVDRRDPRSAGRGQRAGQARFYAFRRS
ncbi:hypothetical protein [Micromonospora sp. RP3T]|uniref:hypothetical protein n=1 Tax=Micromonospora sp. RP3T TaxID=2135446 RepID=UPI000D15A088|nr:hypothetical protein [Micromonospora sp. RP3T]PTA47063.1 hypothetical protein C8054_06020 [Micromonospora sp. RP3T]